MRVAEVNALAATRLGKRAPRRTRPPGCSPTPGGFGERLDHVACWSLETRHKTRCTLEQFGASQAALWECGHVRSSRTEPGSTRRMGASVTCRYRHIVAAYRRQ